MLINHIDDSDLKTLRNINLRLYDATRLSDDDRRDLANLMNLILRRVERVEVEIKERLHG